MYISIIFLSILGIGGILIGLFGRVLGVKWVRIINITCLSLSTLIFLVVFYEVILCNFSVRIELFSWISLEHLNKSWSFNTESYIWVCILVILLMLLLLSISIYTYSNVLYQYYIRDDTLFNRFRLSSRWLYYCNVFKILFLICIFCGVFAMKVRLFLWIKNFMACYLNNFNLTLFEGLPCLIVITIGFFSIVISCLNIFNKKSSSGKYSWWLISFLFLSISFFILYLVILFHRTDFNTDLIFWFFMWEFFTFSPCMISSFSRLIELWELGCGKFVRIREYMRSCVVDCIAYLRGKYNGGIAGFKNWIYSVDAKPAVKKIISFLGTSPRLGGRIYNPFFFIVRNGTTPAIGKNVVKSILHFPLFWIDKSGDYFTQRDVLKSFYTQTNPAALTAIKDDAIWVEDPNFALPTFTSSPDFVDQNRFSKNNQALFFLPHDRQYWCYKNGTDNTDYVRKLTPFFEKEWFDKSTSWDFHIRLLHRFNTEDILSCLTLYKDKIEYIDDTLPLTTFPMTYPPVRIATFYKFSYPKYDDFYGNFKLYSYTGKHEGLCEAFNNLNKNLAEVSFYTYKEDPNEYTIVNGYPDCYKDEDTTFEKTTTLFSNAEELRSELIRHATICFSKEELRLFTRQVDDIHSTLISKIGSQIMVRRAHSGLTKCFHADVPPSTKPVNNRFPDDSKVLLFNRRGLNLSLEVYDEERNAIALLSKKLYGVNNPRQNQRMDMGVD